MIDKIEKQLEEFHKELSEAFENSEKMDQLYATNITITIGSQTIELPFMPETVDVSPRLLYNLYMKTKILTLVTRTNSLEPNGTKLQNRIIWEYNIVR